MLSAGPVFGTLDDNLEVLAGAPLYIALGASDADSDSLSFTATVEGNDNLSVFIPQGNRSVRMSVADYGDMVFELFENWVPNTTAHFIDLVDSGFYNTTDPDSPMTFHRVIDGFMIQGGDPTGTGSGGSGVEFDDEFLPILQHTSAGMLSMAKGFDDTNDSQFFITAEPTRWLDFNHSIFGLLTQGDEVRQEINSVATETRGDQEDVPVEDVVISSMEIFTDPNHAVLALAAPEGTSGTALVTVTVSDGDPTTPDDQHTFAVTILPDTEDANPYLLPIDDIHVTAGGSAQFTIPALDLEGDEFYFGAWTRGDWESPLLDGDFEVNVDPQTGIGTVTMPAGVGGVCGILVGVTPFGPDVIDYQDMDPLYFDYYYEGYSSYWDFQFVPVLVSPAAPTSIELLASSDTGLSTTDGITKLNNADGNALKFRVNGVLEGAGVTLLADGVQIGQATVTGTALPADTVVIITNGTYKLDDGPHSITAVQTLYDQEVYVGNRHDTVDHLVSGKSAPFQLKVDTGVPQFILNPVPPAAEGTRFTYNVQTDAEAEGAVRYSPVTAWPAGMAMDSGTGLITWTPKPGQGPSQTITVKVEDAAGNQNQQQFQILLSLAPQLDPIADQAVKTGELLTFTATATGANAPLVFSLDRGAPAGATIEGDSGVFRWTPSRQQGPGDYAITVRVTDGVTGATMGQTVKITVLFDATGLPLDLDSMVPLLRVASAQSAVAPAPALSDALFAADTSPLGEPIAPAFDFLPASRLQSNIFTDSGMFGTQIGPDTGLGGGTEEEAPAEQGKASAKPQGKQPAKAANSSQKPEKSTRKSSKDEQSARAVPAANDLALEALAEDEVLAAETLAEDEVLAVVLAGSELQ